MDSSKSKLQYFSFTNEYKDWEDFVQYYYNIGWNLVNPIGNYNGGLFQREVDEYYEYNFSLVGLVDGSDNVNGS